MSKGRTIIPIFIPHKGCPHDCSFCNQKKIAGTHADVTSAQVQKTIDTELNRLSDVDKIREIAFYGGSFTGLPIKQQEDFLNIAHNKKKEGLVDHIRISTRPDYINNEIIDLLQTYGVSIIELGVQSTDEEVLTLNNRGHLKEDVFKAVELIKKTNIQLGLQMMVGLYGDTEKKLMNTCKDIISLNPDFVRIYPTIVVKDTLLEKLYISNIYEPLSLDKVVSLCRKLLIEFNKNNIPVIRLGLQATEEITIGKSIVAGPYHPAFREMVETEIYKDIIETHIKNNPNKQNSILNIYCNPKDCSKVSGYNKSNKEYFKNKYCFKQIRIRGLNHIPTGDVNIKIQ